MNTVAVECEHCGYRIQVPLDVAIDDTRVTTTVIDPDAAEKHFVIHVRYCAKNPEATPL